MSDKESYIEEITVWIEAAERDLAEARSRAAMMDDDEERVARMAEIEEMEGKKNALRERFDQFKADTSESWEEIKLGFEKGWNDLKESFASAKERWMM